MVCLQVHEMQVPTIRMLYKFENETFALKKDEVREKWDDSLDFTCSLACSDQRESIAK